MSDPLDSLTGAIRGLEPIIENPKRVFKMDPEDRGGSDYPGGGGPGSSPKEEGGEVEGETPLSTARKIPDEVHDDVTLSESAKTMLAKLAEDGAQNAPVAPVDSAESPQPPKAKENAPAMVPAPALQHVNLTA